MKKIIVILLLLMSSIVYADYNDVTVEIVVDGVTLDTYDQEQNIDLPAFIYNSRTMLPLKKVFALFGISGDQIEWHGEEKSVTIRTNSGDTIWMQIDNKEVLFNDEIVETDVPAKIFENRTFIPLAFVSKLLGETPQWNGDTYTVTMTPSTVYVESLDFEYVLSRTEKYIPVRFDEDDNQYMIEKIVADRTEGYEMILFNYDDKFINDALESYVNKEFMSTDSFTVVDLDRRAYYYENGPKHYVVFIELHEGVLEVEIDGMTINQMTDWIRTIKEVD